MQWHDARGWEEPVDEVPLWTRRTGDPARGLPAAAYVAADGLVALLAKTAYAHVPGAEWTVFYDERLNDIRNHEPVLWHPEHNYHLNVLHRIGVMTWGVPKEGLSYSRLPDRLANLYDVFTGDYNALSRSARALEEGTRQMILPGQPLPPVPEPEPASAPEPRAKDWETGTDLLAFMDEGNALYEIELPEDMSDTDEDMLALLDELGADAESIADAMEVDSDIRVGFSDAVADFADAVIEGLTGDIAGAGIAEVGRVSREDREVILVEPTPGEQIDPGQLERVVAERLRARLTTLGPLKPR